MGISLKDSLVGLLDPSFFTLFLTLLHPTLSPTHLSLFLIKLLESHACQKGKMAMQACSQSDSLARTRERRPVVPHFDFLHLLFWKLLDAHEFLIAFQSTELE